MTGRSITQKIVLLLLTSILPLNLLSLWSSYQVISDSYQTITASTQSSLNSYAAQIDDRISNSNYLLYNTISNDIDFLSFYNEKNPADYLIARQRFFISLQGILTAGNSADAFFIHVDHASDLLVIPKKSSELTSGALLDYVSQVDFEANTGQWSLVTLDKYPCLIKSVVQNGYSYGAIINLQRILNEVRTYTEYSDYQLSIHRSDESLAVPASMQAIVSECSLADAALHMEIPVTEIRKGISLFRWSSIILLSVYILLIPVLYHFLRKWLIKPLKILNLAHRQLEQGHEEYRIVSVGNTDEFQEAYQSFNRMADNIQRLTKETISREVAYKDMLLTNLQLQIRPHFLLNTFNMLYTLVQTNKNQAAQKMILYLSQYFRYLFQYSEDLELFDKEFTLVKQYLEIAEIQYPGRFTFSSQVDPDVSMTRLPPLLLHNFIENIISHALLPDRVVHIMFLALYEDGVVTLQIADDGKGMAEEIIRQINSQSADGLKKGPHLGLRNSVSRLTYFYQGKATIEAESHPNEGTILTITFPYDLEEVSE